MPRNMSFSLTTDQVRNKTKTVTRRMGWAYLRPGDIVNACVKCMGLKKGEKVQKICQLRIVDVREEYLSSITQADVIKEGFPDMDTGSFVEFFAEKNKVPVDTVVTRIEFEYV